MSDANTQRSTPRRSKLTSAQRDALLAHLIDAERPLQAIADVMALTMRDIAELGTQQEPMSTLAKLAMLDSIRAQVLISRFRAHAACRLASMMKDLDDEPNEMARKACVDVLKINATDVLHNGALHNLPADQRCGSNDCSESPEGRPQWSEETILSTFEQLAQAGPV